MAVDVKTLRIGSHVEYDGKQMVVASVSNKLMNCENLILIEPSTLTLYKNVNSYEVEPIPITPALLEELRFINTSWSDRRIVYTNGNEDDNPWIEFKNLKDRWELFVRNEGWQGQTVVRYLHEAEAFLGLHNIELIDD